MKPVTNSDHDIVGGYIAIVKIIDACTFWIQCEKCIHLRKIHKDLKYAFQNTESFESPYKPKVNDLVVVEDIDLTYYRGIVRSEKSDDFFIVHLIDKDEPITVETSFLKSLPRLWRNLKEQGHLIKIYGILPNDDSAGNLNSYRNHNKECENILSEADRILLDEVQIINDVYYGNFKLFIESVPSYYDEIVLQKRLALPSSAFDADAREETIIKHDNQQHDKKSTRKKTERTINISPDHDQFLSELVAGRVFNSGILIQSEMSTQEFLNMKKSSNVDRFEDEYVGHPDLLEDIQKSLARRDRWTSCPQTSGLVEDEDPSHSERSVEEDRLEPAKTSSVSKAKHRRERSPLEGYYSTSSEDLNRSKRKQSGLSKMFKLPKDPFCRSLKKKTELTFPSDRASEERHLDPRPDFSDSDRQISTEKQRRDKSRSRRVDHMEGYDSNSSEDVNRSRKPYSEGQIRPTSFQNRSTSEACRSDCKRASYIGDSMRSSGNVKQSSPICGGGRGKFIDQLRKQFTGTVGLENHTVSTHRSHNTSFGEDKERKSNKSKDSPDTSGKVYLNLSNLKISREHSPIVLTTDMMGGFSESCSSSEEFAKYQFSPEDSESRNRYPPRINENSPSRTHFLGEKKTLSCGPRTDDTSPRGHSLAGKNMSGGILRSRMDEDRSPGSHSFVAKNMSGDVHRSRTDEDRSPGSHSFAGKHVSGDFPRSRMDDDRSPGSHSFAGKHVSGDFPRSRMDDDRSPGSHSFAGKNMSRDSPRSRMDYDRSPGSLSFAGKHVSEDFPRSRTNEGNSPGSHSFAGEHVSGVSLRSKMHEDRSPGSHSVAGKNMSGDFSRSRMDDDRSPGRHSFAGKHVSGDFPRSRSDEDKSPGNHSFAGERVTRDSPQSRTDEEKFPGSQSFAERNMTGDFPRSRTDEDKSPGSHFFTGEHVSEDSLRPRLEDDRSPGRHSFAGKHRVSGDFPRSRSDEEKSPGNHSFAGERITGDSPRSRTDEEKSPGSQSFAGERVTEDSPRSRTDEEKSPGNQSFAEINMSGDSPRPRMVDDRSSGSDSFSGKTTSDSPRSRMNQVMTGENSSSPRRPLGRAKFFASFLPSETQVSSSAQPPYMPMESSEMSKIAVDGNDHADRFYDIEEPEYLNVPLAESAVCADDSPQEESSQPDVPASAYEEMVQASQPHQPVDTIALVKVPKILTSDCQPASFEHRLIVDKTIGQLAERMKMSGGILHGDINCRPVFTISELKLDSHILGNMQAKKLVDLTRCQMYGIPVLLDRRNLILVGTPNSGKTLTYVLSILSLLLDPKYYIELKKGFGPRCVFLTSNAQNANYVSQFCSAFCGAKMTIITTHGGGLELERKTELVNGCEILVSTPRCLLRLLRQNAVTNLNRLCHLVLDDCDTLFHKFMPELKDIFGDVMRLVRGRPRYGVQMVAVGERWSPVLEEMALSTLVDRPVLCITAHLEAALYARVRPVTYFLSPQAKLNKVLELLDKSDESRTVVVCGSASEVKALRVALGQTRPDNVLVAHEEMSLSLIVDVSNEWVRRLRAPLLITTDQVLAELNVTNAQTLIHYSLPENKSYFSERFFCVKEHFYDRIRNPKVGPPECQVYILLDDTNEQQFPEVVNFMERLSTPIPDNINKTVQNILRLREDRKSDTIVCENLFMFGECWKMSRCKRQHIFNKLRDLPRELPTEGLLKVNILHVHNPVHYSVRLLATKKSENEGSWKSFPTNYALIAFKIASYFAKRETRFAHERAKIGDMVAIEVEKDILFRRAKIIDIIYRDEKSNPTEVSVLLLDEGSLQTVRVVDLYYLPEEFHKYPQESYDVYLNNLQPVDFDNAWSFAATSRIIRSIDELSLEGTDDRFFVAKIGLTVGTNVIADWMHCYEWLELNRCHVILCSPRKMLLRTGLAVENPTHLTHLFSLALDAGIIQQLPKGEVEKVEEVVLEEERWAHLESDVFVEVEVTSIINPSLFFVNIIKFGDRLKILQNELNKALNTASIKLDKIEVGMICAANYDLDGQWNRAMITDVYGQGRVVVYFVDYGDSQEVELAELSLLPNGYIKRLPFQAIECDLIGLRCPDIIKGWPNEDIDYFEKLTRDDNIMKELFVKVCDISVKGEVTRGRHFSVIVCDTSSSADILINWEIAIRSGISDPETWHHVKTARDLFHNKSLTVKQQSDRTEEKEEEEDGVSEVEGGEESWRGEECEASPLEMIKQQEAASPPLSDGLQYLMENADNFDIELSEDFVRNFPGLNYFIEPQGVSVQKGIPGEKRAEPGGGRIAAIEDKREAGSEAGEGSLKDEAEECEETESAPPLKGVGAFHPELHWSQSDQWVRIKVLLSDVSRYQLDWNTDLITFCTEVNEKYYWFRIELFGPICPDKTSYTPRGLYFEIKLEKYVEGEDWPRLTLDEVKYSWIKVDPDFIRRNDTASLVEQFYEKGVRLVKEGWKKTEASGEEIPVVGGPPDLDSGSDTGSDISYQYHDLHEDLDN